MPLVVETSLFVILFILLGVIAYLLYTIRSRYYLLTKGVDKKTLSAILEEIVLEIKSSKKDIDFLKKQCDTIEKDGVLHIQKIGLLRFNPFKDTGGDQSFIMALLDANNTGVVISSLYARSGTRWYAKRIVNGNAIDHELSDEEKKAIKEAKSL